MLGCKLAQGGMLQLWFPAELELLMSGCVAKVLSLLVVSSVFAVGCGVSRQPSLGAVQQFPTPEGVEFYYVTCDSNARELSESTRLICEDSQCISMARTFTVTPEFAAAGPDTCTIIRTKTMGAMSADAEILGTYAFRGGQPAEINRLHAPDSAMLSGTGEVIIDYKSAGTYKFWLTRARQAIAVEWIP